MSKLLLSAICGVLGTLPFLLGGAASNGGILSAFVVPAWMFEFAVSRSDVAMDEVQLNRMSVLAQFIGYFLFAYCAVTIRSMIRNKHNNAFKGRRAKRARP
jgi:hypothetical protein